MCVCVCVHVCVCVCVCEFTFVLVFSCFLLLSSLCNVIILYNSASEDLCVITALYVHLHNFAYVDKSKTSQMNAPSLLQYVLFSALAH